MTADQFEALIKSGAKGRELLSAYRQMVARLSLEIADRDEEILRLKTEAVPEATRILRKRQIERDKKRRYRAKQTLLDHGVEVDLKGTKGGPTGGQKVDGPPMSTVDKPLSTSLSTRPPSSNILRFPFTETSSEPSERSKDKKKVEPAFPTPDDIVECIEDGWNAMASKLRLPLVKIPISESRREKLVARIRQAGTVDAFFDVTEMVEKSKFLSGRAPASPGRKPFRLTFDWFINLTNFTKILEGNYTDEQAKKQF